MPPRDFYDVLGVSRTASTDDIQRAYRKLARTYHPDINKEPGAEDRFKEVSEAYDVLSDPETRGRYDAFGPQFRQVPEGVDPETWAAAQAGGGRRRAGAGSRGAPGGGGGGFTWTTSEGDGDGFSGFGDIDLDDLLGGFFSRGRTGGAARRGPAPGADTEAEVPLTVEEAFTGTRRRITLSGRDGERTVDVTIPPGVVDGQRIRVAGQGGPGGDGGPAGDLYLVARIQPHPRFRLEGRNIFVDLPVTPWEAALGAKVPVEAPGGQAKVTVPAGSSSGRRLRLKGQGLPNPKGQPGDLYAVIRIMVPKRLQPRERELFEELARVSDFDPRRER
jgi:curved DNA-binding protein